uniref:Zeta toxin domain-containing protein n=1 Tax=Streptomyces sp. NBC_00049 TaxID=2903617 RepID=A0AAU2JYY2_9ACTN
MLPHPPRRPPHPPRAADPQGARPLPGQFVVGTHPQYGYVAAAQGIPHHISHWYLTRLGFQSLHGLHGVYLLPAPTHERPRRTRQAIESLRRSGYKVHADYSLDPANTKPAQTNPVRDPREWYRTGISQAAATTSPQYATQRAWGSRPPQTTPVSPAPSATTQPSRAR